MDDDQVSEDKMRARAEYYGFEHILQTQLQQVPSPAEASAPHAVDITRAVDLLHKLQCAALFS